jgi:hypothetical protein
VLRFLLLQLCGHTRFLWYIWSCDMCCTPFFIWLVMLATCCLLKGVKFGLDHTYYFFKIKSSKKYVSVMTSNHLNMDTVHIPQMTCVCCIRYTIDSGKCHIIAVICKQFGISQSAIRLLFVLIFLYSLNNPHNNQIFTVVLNVLHQISLTCLYDRWLDDNLISDDSSLSVLS